MEKDQFDFQTQNFMLNLLKKKFVKKSSILKARQILKILGVTYNFFSAFDDFRTLPDNSGKPKSVDLKQKNLL